MCRWLRIVIVLLGVACSSAAAARLSVFACEPEWAALVAVIGGREMTVTSATTALQDPHHVQPRPSLISRARRADLLVCTGAQLEIGWLPLLLRQAANPRLQPGAAGYFLAAREVRLLGMPAVVDRRQGDIHPYGNPHVQTDPRRIARVARALEARLEALDPAHADGYRHRYQDFARRWRAATERWEQMAAPLRGLPIVVHHDSWIYLEDWLGLRQVGTLEPKPGVPPSAAHLAALASRLRQQPARLIIRAAYQDPRPAVWLSRHTGIPTVVLPFTVGGAPGASDLFGLFEVTLERLLRGAS